VHQQRHSPLVPLASSGTALVGCAPVVVPAVRAARDRVKSAKKMREHIQNPDNNRLLLFPEGTCAHNRYCVQFKQGVFDMGAEVCPIAIKYNSIFVDAFWNRSEATAHTN